MDPETAMHEIGTALGFGLLEARSSRLGLATIDYIDRAMMAAGARCRKQLMEAYIIEG